MINTLKDTQLFQGLADAELAAIAGFSTRMALSAGQALFSQEQADYDLFLLVRGSLDVLGRYSGLKQERKMLLAPVDREIFGEVAWCLKSQRTAVITSRGESEVVRIDGERFDAFLRDHPETGMLLTQRIMAVLARKLANTNSMLGMVLQNSFVV